MQTSPPDLVIRCANPRCSYVGVLREWKPDPDAPPSTGQKECPKCTVSRNWFRASPEEIAAREEAIFNDVFNPNESDAEYLKRRRDFHEIR